EEKEEKLEEKEEKEELEKEEKLEEEQHALSLGFSSAFNKGYVLDCYNNNAS
ncbi:hypothetical protein K505DRAFT_369103, partial [Melanomma pulvis-pyrius CBS 109.77]